MYPWYAILRHLSRLWSYTFTKTETGHLGRHANFGKGGELESDHMTNTLTVRNWWEYVGLLRKEKEMCR